MIKEAIILAGGLGTRLQSVVADVPKCLAPVNGIPFLHYVIQYAAKQGIEHFILSVGYKREKIREFIASQNYAYAFTFCEETQPLGTGGAICKALTFAANQQVLVLNGDTFHAYPLMDFATAHEKNAADCTICLKQMQNFSRYGVVARNEKEQIISFREKQFMKNGHINTGVYAINKETVLNEKHPEKFSFENDYMAKNVATHKFYGFQSNSYFIDIGTPEDFTLAQTALKNKYDY